MKRRRAVRFWVRVCVVTGALVALLAGPGSALSVGGYRDAVLADSPVGYWRLGESSGTTAANEVSTAPAGTYQGGVTLGAAGALNGDANTAVALNGANGFAYAPGAAAWDLGNGPLTVEAWVKRASANRTDVIVHKGTNAYQLRFGADNRLALTKANISTIATSNRTVTDTAWHHVAATKNGSDVHLYLDGSDVTGTVTDSALQNASGSTLRIGTDSSSYLSGSIDEVAIYNTALSAARIQAHYEAGAGPPPPPPPPAQTIVTLAFDDGYADQYTIRSDLSARGMHATFYVNSGSIGVSSSAMSWQQLHDLAGDGNEIAGHTVLHPDLLTVSATEERREVCNDRVNLMSQGFSPTSFALPFGSGDDVTRGIVQQCGYNTARGAAPTLTPTGPYAETIPPQNPYALRTPPGVAYSTTLVEIQGWVTRAEQNGGGWIELRFHHVCDGCDPLSITRPNFVAVLDWLAARAANGTLVKTNHEVWGGALQTGVQGPPAPATTAVTNPSLETDANGDLMPDCWSTAGYGANTPTWTWSSDAHSGGFGERLDVTGYTNGARHLLTRLDLGDCTPTAVAGKAYDLSGWYKAAVPVRFFVYYRNSMGGFVYWTTSPSLAAASNWTRAIWRTPALPAGATGIAFGLSLAANGSLTTDDFSIAENVDTTAPIVALNQPANGSSTQSSTPTYAGAAGILEGDLATVTVRVYAGSAATGSPVDVSTATRQPDGTYSVVGSTPLTVGTYTAQAEQSDASGNLGKSQANTFTVSSSPPPGYASSVLADAPAAYWRFGESGGPTAVDEKGTSPAGYWNGVVLGALGALTSDPNTAAQFDGVDDFARALNTNALDPRSALSLELWIKPASLPSSSATLLRKDGQYLLRLTSTGGLVFRVWKGGSTKEATAAGVVAAGAWHQLVATYNGSTMRLYVNATQRGSTSFTGQVDSTTNSLFFATSQGYDFFAGALDEVAVYPTALSAARIQAHYAAA